MQFCQFAADRGVAPAHDVGEIGKRVLHAIAGFEHHQRRVDPGELGEPRAARMLPGGQKALEEEPVGRQRRDRKRRQYRRRSRHGDHRMAGGADFADQLEAGIGDQGRAGVRDQGDRGALPQPLQDFRPRQRGVVLVIGFEIRRDRVTLGQAAGDAGVLAGDDVDAGQRFQRA